MLDDVCINLNLFTFPVFNGLFDFISNFLKFCWTSRVLLDLIKDGLFGRYRDLAFKYQGLILDPNLSIN